MAYHNYLKSKHWKETKDRFFKVKKYRCSICFARKDLCVHHKNYQWLGKETSADLTYLCHNCHNELHSRKDLKLFTFGERWRLLLSMEKNKKARRANNKAHKRKWKPIFNEIEKYHEDFDSLVRSF